MRGTAVTGLIDAACRAIAQLDRDDVLGERLLYLIERAEASRSWADLALAIRLVEPLFDRLAEWPAPLGAPAPDIYPHGLHEERDPLRRADAMRWLAAVTALQALELGPGSPMGRALASGAVALARGDATGLGWIVSAVGLSRAET